MAKILCGGGNSSLNVTMVDGNSYSPNTTITSLNISIDSNKRYGFGNWQAGSGGGTSQATIGVIIDHGSVIWTSTGFASLNVTVEGGKLKGNDMAGGYGGIWSLYEL